KPVDLSNLRFSIGDDKELEKELFGEFINSSSAIIKQLEKNCTAQNDNESWRQAAHALKGIAANLGAVPLAALCRTAQEKFEHGPDEKTALLKNIKESHSEVVKFLNSQ